MISRLSAGLLAAALLVTGCGGNGQDTSTETAAAAKVGLITKTETNPFFVKMKEGAQKAAEAEGVELMTAAGKFDGDNACQITAIENMVAAGVKGILITPSDTKAIVPAIKKARDAGVLVIALDTPTDPQDATDALFATDNLKAGELIGQYAKAAMAGKPAKIATLDLAPGVTVGQLSARRLPQGLRHQRGRPVHRLLPGHPAATSPRARPRWRTACRRRPTSTSSTPSTSPPPSARTPRSRPRAGEKDVLVVSVDGGCTGVKAVQNGKIAATSQQYPAEDGRAGRQGRRPPSPRAARSPPATPTPASP